MAPIIGRATAETAGAKGNGRERRLAFRPRGLRFESTKTDGGREPLAESEPSVRAIFRAPGQLHLKEGRSWSAACAAKRPLTSTVDWAHPRRRMHFDSLTVLSPAPSSPAGPTNELRHETLHPRLLERTGGLRVDRRENSKAEGSSPRSSAGQWHSTRRTASRPDYIHLLSAGTGGSVGFRGSHSRRLRRR